MTPAARPSPPSRRTGEATRTAGPATVAGLSIGGLAAATGVGIRTCDPKLGAGDPRACPA